MSTIWEKIKSFFSGLVAILGGLYLLKVLFDRTNTNEALSGNPEALNQVKDLQNLKDKVDEDLKNEQDNRDNLVKENEEEKKKDLSNEDLADYFNNRK